MGERKYTSQLCRARIYCDTNGEQRTQSCLKFLNAKRSREQFVDGHDEMMEQWKTDPPMKRVGQPEEIASAMSGTLRRWRILCQRTRILNKSKKQDSRLILTSWILMLSKLERWSCRSPLCSVKSALSTKSILNSDTWI